MGRKSTGRKPPPPPAPAAGWRLLPPAAPAHERATEADALEGVVAALDAMRAEFFKAHGREPTEAEVIELVSLGLADGLDDDLTDDLLIDEEATALGCLPDATEDDDEENGDEDDEDGDEDGPTP